MVPMRFRRIGIGESGNDSEDWFMKTTPKSAKLFVYIIGIFHVCSPWSQVCLIESPHRVNFIQAWERLIQNENAGLL